MAELLCITQDSSESSLREDYLQVCTRRADLLAASIHCEGTGCGGHPICRPCYDLGLQRGLIRPSSSRQER